VLMDCAAHPLAPHISAVLYAPEQLDAKRAEQKSSVESDWPLYRPRGS